MASINRRPLRERLKQVLAHLARRQRWRSSQVIRVCHGCRADCLNVILSNRHGRLRAKLITADPGSNWIRSQTL